MSSAKFFCGAAAATALLVFRGIQRKRATQASGSSTSDDAITVGYWGIAGLANPIRMLLAYSGLPFNDKRYYAIKEGDGPVDRSQWNDVKYTLGLDFPNLPYVIHGDVKITESNACLIYVANLAGVAGNTAAERAHVEMMLCKVMDLRNAVIRVGYSPKAEFASRLAAFKEGLPRHLDGMTAFLGDKQWLVSCGLTAPDFHLYEMLRQVTAMVPGCLDGYPTLQAYKRRFEALPAIKRYQTSGNFLDRPFNQPYSSFH